MNKFVPTKNYPDIYSAKSSYFYLDYELVVYEKDSIYYGNCSNLSYSSNADNETELKNDFNEYVNQLEGKDSD